MEINLSDEKIEQLVEREVTRYVGARIDCVMRDGKAHWFSQQNIENITKDIVERKISSDCLKQVCDMLKTDEFIHCLSDCIAEQVRDYLFE